MSFISVGAFLNGERLKTKKSLKEALASDPTSLTFDGTSGFAPKVIRGEELDGVLGRGVKLVVTGPDPYTDRRWHAQIELNTRTDKIIVK